MAPDPKHYDLFVLLEAFDHSGWFDQMLTSKLMPLDGLFGSACTRPVFKGVSHTLDTALSRNRGLQSVLLHTVMSVSM